MEVTQQCFRLTVLGAAHSQVIKDEAVHGLFALHNCVKIHECAEIVHFLRILISAVQGSVLHEHLITECCIRLTSHVGTFKMRCSVHFSLKLAFHGHRGESYF